MDSFVIRVWSPAEGSAVPTEPMRGTVEHVATGRHLTFTSEGDLLAFVREAIRPVPEHAAAS